MRKTQYLWLGLVVQLVLLTTGMVLAHPDDSYWSDEFEALHGVDGNIFAITEYGGKIVVAGDFTSAGGRAVASIAAWDGIAWTPLGSQNLHGTVFAVYVHDGKLYAGGCFYLNDSSTVFGNHNIAVLENGTWQWVGGYANDTVFALGSFNGQLVAGGSFTSIGGNSAFKVARYDGARWSRFENALVGTVRAISVFRGELVVAGALVYRWPDGALPEALGGAARWDGTRFRTMNYGFSMANPLLKARVNDVIVLNDRLIACGIMDMAVRDGGNEYVHGIASWDGAYWTALGQGLDTAGLALCLYRDTLAVAAGRRVLRWTGTAWTQLGEAFDNGAIHSLSGGFSIWAGGTFTSVAGISVSHLAFLAANQQWSPASTGLNNYVTDLACYQGRLFVVGAFGKVAQQRATGVAAWTGTAWDEVGSLYPGARSLAEFGGVLYVAGVFGSDPNANAYPLEVFDGVAAWTRTGPLLERYAIASAYPINSAQEYGGRLVLGGSLFGGQFLNLLSWAPGTNWATVGALPNFEVKALLAHQGKLVAAGLFTIIGTTPVSRIAAWDGVSWSSLGTGIDGVVYALGEYNGMVVAGGFFQNAGGQPASNIALWNGSQWRPLAAGTDGAVRAVTHYGSHLIVGGNFSSAGGTAAANIAAWDGDSWSPLGSGVDNTVYTLGVMDTSLYVGGTFGTAGGQSSPYFARWNKFSEIATAVVDDPTVPLPAAFALNQNYPNPFNPTTTITFHLPTAAQVRLEVYNLIGQRVATLVNGVQAAGTYTAGWDAGRYASGVYLYRLTADGYAESRKMLLLR